MCTCGRKSLYWKPGEDFLQNWFHFPAFEDLPCEGEIVDGYWKLKKGVLTPACTWFFMGEITNDDTAQVGFLHNRVLVSDRDNQDDIPIAFYPERGYLDFKMLKNCNTIFVATAQQHHFLDTTIGLRVEDLNTVTVAPCSMEEMFALSQDYHESKNTKCWWCGKEDMACPSPVVDRTSTNNSSTANTNVEGLKKCSACKVARYCSRECQLCDWKEGLHKWCCKAMPIFTKLTKINYAKYDTTALLGPAHFIPGLMDCKKS